MKIEQTIDLNFNYYKNLRHALHAVPKIGFEEHKTAKIIADELNRLGIPFEANIATTGIIATLSSGTTERSIAFRADFDALPIKEENRFDYVSQHSGMMHACGHDGHTTILLAFAKVLTENRYAFDGTVHLIFQPAEEGIGGAEVMIEEGILERYKIDKIFAIHNRPTEDVGKIFVRLGNMMASYDNYWITVHGKSSHSSMPQTGKNPIVVAAQIVTAIKSIGSLNLSPLKKSVITVASIKGGEALNIIPNRCEIAGSIRSYDDDVRSDIEARIKEIATHMAKGFGMEAEILYTRGYPATVNNDVESATKAAEATVGKVNTITEFEASFGAEDFSYFLHEIPGCYAWLGSKRADEEIRHLHSANYDFNDELLKIGTRYFMNIVQIELEPSEV